jgi:hypothetical protein
MRLGLAAALGAALTLLAAPASASYAVALEVPALSARADTVVRGRVVAQHARWNRTHTRIYTDVSVAVDHVYKGSADSVVLVTRLGGSLGGIGMRVSGEASFTPGEEVILFLARHTRGASVTHTVLGMAQGKLTVLRGGRGPRVLLSPGQSGIRLVAQERDNRLRARPAAAVVRGLDEVEREIRSAQGTPAPRPSAAPSRGGRP